MTETKTFVIPEGGSGYGGGVLDPNLLLSMNGGGFGMNGGVWPLIYMMAFRGIFGDNYGGNTSQIQEQLNSIQGQNALMSAIQGGTNEVRNLATVLNSDINAVQATINALHGAVSNVSNQTGMGFMQVVNAVQNGDSGIINSMQSCCCDMKNLITNLNYEGRLADQAQTAFLGGKIDAQTTLINDKFCQLEMRSMQDKLDQERAKNLALTNQLSQEHQNATFAAIVAPIKADVEEIKCKQPATVTVPYSPVTPVPSCVAWNAAIYGGYPYAQQGNVFS